MELKHRKNFDETGDKTTNRICLAIPFEVHSSLLELANELDFGHAGKVSTGALIEAVSKIEPETLYDLLRSEGLLPKKKLKDSLYA